MHNTTKTPAQRRFKKEMKIQGINVNTVYFVKKLIRDVKIILKF